MATFNVLTGEELVNTASWPRLQYVFVYTQAQKLSTLKKKKNYPQMFQLLLRYVHNFFFTGRWLIHWSISIKGPIHATRTRDRTEDTCTVCAKISSFANRMTDTNKFPESLYRSHRMTKCWISVLVSISVFMALSTVFHSINPPDSSPFSDSLLPVLSLPYWSFQLYISLWRSPSALI